MKYLLSDKIINLVNYRIEQEEYSSRLYHAISVCMSYKGYEGAAALFAEYSKEEHEHAKWAYDYLLSMDIKPVTPALEAPPEEFESLPFVINLSFEHEVEILNQCKDLAQAAFSEGDFTTFGLAQKYINEQVDEIDKTTNLLDKLEAFGEDKIALRLLDNEMKEEASNG